MGRTWGYRPSPLPTREQAHELLAKAIELGVTIFDTAPAYGQSEQLAGEFFRQLPAATRDRLRLATKCGEHWDSANLVPFVDHSYDALVRSIDHSLEVLGRIDLLQVHKATVQVLQKADLWKALDYARSCGIHNFGASVTDLETGRLACSMDGFRMIQLPLNQRFRALEALVVESNKRHLQVWTNRPFAMGQMIHEDGISQVEAYRLIVSLQFHGAVLTGTSNPQHLAEDLNAFRRAVE